MKPTLQVKLGQQLTLTPQLRQAIRLLQLSAVELNLEINLAVDSNPLLEREDEVQAEPADDRDSQSSESADDAPDFDFDSERDPAETMAETIT